METPQDKAEQAPPGKELCSVELCSFLGHAICPAPSCLLSISQHNRLRLCGQSSPQWIAEWFWASCFTGFVLEAEGLEPLLHAYQISQTVIQFLRQAFDICALPTVQWPVIRLLGGGPCLVLQLFQILWDPRVSLMRSWTHFPEPGFLSCI